MTQDFINVIEWNANGIRNKKVEFFSYLQTNNIHVACISETKLKSTDKLTHTDYKVFRINCEDDIRAQGGVAIITHHSINTEILSDLNLEIIQAIGLKVFLNDGNSINIYSAYFTGTVGRHDYDAYRRDIRKLTTVRNAIVLADLNAKHNYWGCTRENRAGRILFEEIMNGEFEIFHPPNPTYYPGGNRTPSILDVMLSTTHLDIEPLVNLPDLGSDHLPFLARIMSRPKTSVNTFPCFNKADWNKYRTYLNRHIDLNDFRLSASSSTQDIDNCISKFTEILNNAVKVSVPRKRKKPQDRVMTDEIRQLIKRREAAKRRLIRNGHRHLRDEYNFYKYEVERRCMEVYNDSYQQHLSTIIPNENHNRKLFSLSRTLRGKKSQLPFLKDNDQLLTTESERAELLSNVFLENHNAASTVTVPRNIQNVVNQSEQCLNSSPNVIDPNTLVKPKDVASIIKSLPSNKAPGEDGVRNIMLKQCSRKAVVAITMIFNACIMLSYFPTAWKSAVTTPICKPGKPSDLATSYRPISLLSALGKLFERVLLPRLTDHLEDHNLLPDFQFGFRRGHSTTQQVYRIVKSVRSALNRSESSGLVLLDLKSAFDTAWHGAILHKMMVLNFPVYLTKLVQSFLDSRSFKVRVGSSYSTVKYPESGVPQGGVSSPILFNILLYDIPTPPNCVVTQFADDVGLKTSAKRAASIKYRLQNGTKSLSKFFRRWKLKLNPEKTEAVFFTRRRAARAFPRADLQVEGHNINWGSSAKYLGVTLDRRLTFKPHIDNVVKKSGKVTRMLYSLLCRNSRLHTKNKLLLYKTVIRPLIFYASPAWSTCAATHIKLLQRLQNRLLKMCLDRHWRHPTIELHDEAGVQMVQDFLNNAKQRFFSHCSNSTNPLILNLL